MNDSGLLRDYVHQHSEEAFRSLVRHHTNLVFGTAMRRTGDTTAAEEITQNVFLTLAHKAIWLQSHTSLAAWLHRTTLLEARQWWRGESRRQRREQAAIALETTMKTSPADSHAFGEAIDESLLELAEKDRQALLLRFFEGRNHREVGVALGIGEDAARKRIDKALSQLSGVLRKRGLAVGTTAALAVTLTSASHAAPVALSATAAQFALAKASTGAIPVLLPILAKLLGMNRAHLAIVSFILLLIPLIWQGAQLSSLGQEQQRMKTLLASLQATRTLNAESEASILSQLQAASNRLSRAQSQVKPSFLFADYNPKQDPRLYRWNDSTDYVRVPKKSLDWMAFDGENSTWRVGSFPDEEKVIALDGRVSPTLLKALGLDAGEQAHLQSYFQTCVRQYTTFAESQARIRGPEALPSTTPSFVQTNEHTRVWSLPPLSETVSTWKAQFEKGLSQLIGEERTRVLFDQADQDSSLNHVFQDFGNREPLIVVTPLPTGGCSLARTYSSSVHPMWHGNYNLPISIVLTANAADKFGPMNGFLDRPMPASLIDYLRQWQQAHPQVPDAPTKK